MSMREDLELIGKRAARDSRASEWIQGFRQGVLLGPIPKSTSEDCKDGYKAGRGSMHEELSTWLTSKKLLGIDLSEVLNLIMRLG